MEENSHGLMSDTTPEFTCRC